MITISVGGTPLFIPEDTALVLEQNNAALSDDGITADIVWTFEIPAEPNQRILGAVQYLWSSGNRRYDCELAVDGVPISRGYLYVQSSSDERTLQCGMVANNFTVGFGEKMLRENDYGDDIVISETESNHKTGWRQFLLDSLKASSVYKFFLFMDSQFYSDNEDYGYYKDKISPLVNDNRENREFTFGYVNRLFWLRSWSTWHGTSGFTDTLVEDAESSKRGARIFNKDYNGKKNGYCFAPALRLDWLVRKVLANAGLSSKGTFFQSEEIKRLYSQSMNAMDGDTFDYGIYTWLQVRGNITASNDTITNCQPFRIDADSNEHTAFKWGSNVSIGFRLLLPVDELQHVEENETVGLGTNQGYAYVDFKKKDEVYAIAIRPSGAELPNLRMSTGSNEADGTKVFKYGKFPTGDELISRANTHDDPTDLGDIWLTGNGNCRFNWWWGPIPESVHSFQFYTDTNSMLIQLTRSDQKRVNFVGDLGGYTEGTVAPLWRPNWSSTTKLFLQLVKCKIHTTDDPDVLITASGARQFNSMEPCSFGELEGITDYEIQDTLTLDSTDIPLNIFSHILKWKEHVPNLSNGEFLSKMSQAFGLAMFVNPMTREVQLDFFVDVMRGSCFDISQWVTAKERQEYSPKEYTITMKTVIGKKEVSERNQAETANTKDVLPPASIRKNKHALVLNELVNRRSTQIKDQSKFRWEQAGGDTRSLKAGAKDAKEREEVEIDVMIPNMAYADELSTAADKYMCQIEAKGCSPMLDEDYSGEFDMVLQQYRGTRYIENIGNIEDANPTIYDQEGNEVANAINLSAVGKRSIGEMWLKPLYDMKGDSDRYRIVAHLPAWAFLQVMATLQPQEGSIYEQKRWILCDGIRIMPTRISSELSGRDTVICTIEGAAPHTDNSGGYPYVEVADRFLLGDQNDYVLADENDYALEIEI